ncbi:MAG TPA: BrnT family toxin [Terriglobia bacterium]|nr:BrnT family toxin [Terriglobia bacterium]
MDFQFEWDRHKAKANLRKHEVSYTEALTVFMDPLAYTIEDAVHSETETREVIIGHSSEDRLLLVGFTQRAEDVIRIFSAREATRKERRDYEENANS